MGEDGRGGGLEVVGVDGFAFEGTYSDVVVVQGVVVKIVQLAFVGFGRQDDGYAVVGEIVQAGVQGFFFKLAVFLL